MQVSMLWLSAEDVRLAVGKGGRVPAVGDEIDCRVRHTTSALIASWDWTSSDVRSDGGRSHAG